MKAKQKRCRADGCGKLFTPYTSLTKCCSITCALQYNQDNPKEVKTFIQTQQAKQDKEQLKQMKFNITKLSTFESIAKKVFQHWVRLRDRDHPCISCNAFSTPQWDGGHYLKAEIYSGVIFYPMNVNKQCCHCNDHLQGNVIEYRKGMIKKYGEEELLKLEAKGNELRYYKYSREELIEITNKYKLKIKNKDFNN